MDRVRSAFNSVMDGERYSRFTVQPDDEGGSHVEVKLADNGIDDATVVTHQPGGSSCSRLSTLKQQSVCWMTLGVMTLFVLGYLLGYVSHRIPPPCPPLPTALPTEKMPIAAPEAPLDWKNITGLLTQKLTSQAFDKTLSVFGNGNRAAGSEEDIRLAEKIYNIFKTQEMDPWTDIHYVQLQTSDSKRPNHVLFGSDDFQPTGYLAYSANGTATGKVVYGNYGREEDLKVLQKKNITELKGCVMLLRAGRISFAQQVNNAAEKGAASVLIYPDPQDYRYGDNVELYGHVHLGSGDPYTPGFPSFNHTQFPPTQSSGLPTIPAQTITAQMAEAILQKMGGPEPEASSGFKGGLDSVPYTLGGSVNITVEVNNVLVNREIHNVFGVIKGFVEPDRYVVLGAQRDAWGQGYARATVGTTILMELAKAVHEMVEKDGFRPRRSLVFASWAAGEYGNVGATEWLEGYMSSLDRRAVTYISLDGVVMGRGGFVASSSPLLHSLIESTMKEVKSPLGSGSMYNMVGGATWMRPMAMEDPAYPFLASSGIPSLSFHFITPNVEGYPYYGTNLDNMDHLRYATNGHTAEMAAVAGQFAGQMALRLAHDHLLRLDVERYRDTITKAVVKLHKHISKFSKSEGLTSRWLLSARGSFNRAVDGIKNDMTNTHISDKEAIRIINGRIMVVEHALLSPYVSPRDVPFRHVLLGQGSHTLAAISETSNMEQLRTQLALATWTLQGCANAMVGDIWDIDNQI